MGGGKDYRDLVPRTPPEGLEAWTRDICGGELDRYGLVYEAAYDDEDDFCSWPIELPEKRKRTKMVRVTCSCCGDRILLDWGKDAAHGYGFIHPDDQEGDWEPTVTAAGDETTCPICGERVLVTKRAAVRGYYVSAEYHVMSAGVLEGGELVLTGWTVQRRVHKTGWDELKFLPAEAYVYTKTGCVQLMGWTCGHSGTGGYYIQYCSSWRQPKEWRERWGQEKHIFGLTPELIEGSCLPNCKLDVYMAQRPGARHFPVAWLRLYQAHPNAEAVLLHGLPMVLDDLITAKAGAHDWLKKNEQGRMELPLDWTQTRPAQILGLTKEELRLGRTQHWGRMFWELFVSAKGIGELLTAEDMQNAFCLGDSNLIELVPRRQAAKSIRYLLRQCEKIGAEVDDEGVDPAPDALLLRDYWNMAEQLGRDLSDPSVKYPADLIEAHDRAAALMKLREQHIAAEQFRIRRRLLRKYAFSSGGLLIRPAASLRELTAEGDALHHCVGIYGKRHAEGKTAIFFIRRASCPKTPYFTLELDEEKLEVRQNRGMCNCDPPEEVKAFVEVWLAWARAGAKRCETRKTA